MMMSNPPSSLHQAPQLHHRRQNSTPVVAFEAMKVSNSNMPQSPQRQGVHRRGISFDQQQRSPIRRQQPTGMVSITNVAQQLGQQILREAQQQRANRPGQPDLPVSPQCGIFPGSSPNTTYDQMTMNTIMHHSPQMQFANSPYYPPDMSQMQPQYQGMPHVDENNQQYFQQMHQPQQNPNAVFDARRMSQPELRVQTGMRPHTPQEQLQNAQFPLTPPCTQPVHHTVQYSRSGLNSPAILSPLPVPMQRGRSLQGIIEHEESKPHTEIRQRPQSMIATSSRQPQSFEVADMPVPNMIQSPAKTPISKVEAHSSPLPFFDATGGSPAPLLSTQPVPILRSTQEGEEGSLSPSRKLALSPRRMSISDLNLEPGIDASIEETNVTLDEISTYIEGPDPNDGKYVCTFDECNKRFGRKENIKSHVQTHLGDRQFRCDHCKKCFVRGHDLKRHAKIHTGSKPYPCLCGNAFARHDALTRHRQRGMCIGAFEGVVKKEVKRGRPRKHRPEMDDRVDKATRTRNANDSNAGDMFDQYNSSASSCSYSSWGSPPTENMDSLSMADHHSPFDAADIALFGVPQGTMGMGVMGMGMGNETMAFPPDMFSFTPPASPGYSTGQKPSPSHTHRSLTPVEHLLPTHTQSHHGSPVHHSSPMHHVLPVIQGVPIITATIPPSSLHNSPIRTNAIPMHKSQHSLPSLSNTSSSPIQEAADVAVFDFAEMPIPISSAHMQMSSMTAMAPSKMENDFDTYFDIDGGMDLGMPGMGMPMGMAGDDPFFDV